MSSFLYIFRFSSLFIFFIFSFLSVSYAAYNPPGGNNNDIQYKNGLSYGGSDSFVTNGTNVGIGTFNPFGGNLIVNGGGNVGIGSLVPGQALDVKGTIRTTSFIMSGQSPTSGYVLTAADSSGDTTWSSAGGVSGWTVSGNNVYETASGNVGIGTTFLTTSALSVMNGNVGIGTWLPTSSLNIMGGNLGIGTTVVSSALSVVGGVTISNGAAGTPPVLTGQLNALSDSVHFIAGFGDWIRSTNGSRVAGMDDAITSNGQNLDLYTNSTPKFEINANGNVGIGSLTPIAQLDVEGSISPTVFNAASGSIALNVGIGSFAPGQKLDVTGTIRTTNFTMSGQSPSSGYVLTAVDSSGDTTWSSAGGVSGWTTSGNNVYETSGGNVGIGTTFLTTSALTVMNGNVGIGTWVPSAEFQVNNASTPFIVTSTGNVGIGTSTVVTPLQIYNGNAGIYLGYSGSSGFGYIHLGNAAPTGTNYALAADDGNTLINSTSSGSIVFKYNNNQNVVFTSAGNVGIGTLTPFNQLDVNGSVGIGTSESSYVATTAPAGGMIVQGNVGIGSLSPGQALDVQGTIRTTNFAMSGQSPTSGYVLTAADSSGDATWSSASSVSGWTVTGNNVYETNAGNVGIGTTFLTTSALSVMNGNVGIGTWVPANIFEIGTQKLDFTAGGNLGIGTSVPSATLQVNGSLRVGNGTNAFNPSNGYGIITSSSGNAGLTISQNGTSNFTSLDLVTNNSTNYGWSVQIQANDSGLQFADRQSGPTRMYIQQGTGNIGIGTINPAGGLVVTSGNVGIGTMNPISPLGLLQVVTATDSTSGQPNGFSSAETVIAGAGGNNGGVFASYNQTTNTGFIGSLSPGVSWRNLILQPVTAGHVGIGTFTPTSFLDIAGGTTIGSGFVANTSPSNGLLVQNNVGIGTVTTANTQGLSVLGGASFGSYATSAAPAGGLIISGNVGISSLTPGQALDVTGTVRTTNFIMSGQSPTSGYVLTAADSSGDTTWSSAGGVSGWTVSGNNVYETASGNVGIGTTFLTTSALSVMNGNVGIGTWIPAKLFSVTGDTYHNGNIGIGTTFVGGAGEAALTVMNGNVGIGTWVPGAALVVMNGNVGIGTTNPAASLELKTGSILLNNGGGYAERRTTGGALISLLGISSGTDNVFMNGGGSDNSRQLGIFNSGGTLLMVVGMGGNVGIGTSGFNNKLSIAGPGGVGIGTVAGDGYINTSAPSGGMIVEGNVGIGSLTPGQALDVTGTVRTTSFIMSGQSPTSGYVLTAADSSGDTTWSSAGGVSGWTVSGNNVYETASGNVGIGTTFLTTSALSVMNGNVGIGTWVPGSALQVNGNIGIGTSGNNAAPSLYFVNRPNSGLYFSSGANGIVTTINSTATALVSAAGLAIPVGDRLGWSSASTADGAGTDTAFSRVAANVVAVGNGTASNFTGTFSAGNIGISTITPVNQLVVNGGVGIGTANSSFITTTAPTGGIIIQGNVGIGSLNPGQALDVTGTVRTTSFIMSGQSPTSGYVLTAADSSGDTTWSSAGGVSGWTVSGNNVYETASGNVGIGTTFLTTSALSIMNGNVGIGTWLPSSALSINGGIQGANGTVTNPTYSFLAEPNYGVYMNSSTKMSFVVAGQDQFVLAGGGFMSLVQGAVLGFYSSGITASDTGISRTAAATLAIGNGASANSSGTLLLGNIGIGTTLTTSSALSVMNGNVGIGTWVPSKPFSVTGDAYHNGNIGIGTTFVGGVGEAALSVMNGNVGIGTWTPSQILTVIGNIGIGTATGTGSGRIIAPNGSLASPSYGFASSTNSGLYFNQFNQLIIEANGGIAGLSGGNTFNSGGFQGTSSTNLNFFLGNVGVGSQNPGQILDVQGTVRTTNFIMSGQSPTSGYVLTAADSSGDTTWSSAGGVSGWTVSGNNVYETNSGNVGIGTTFLTTSALSVMNGNVGIGTWAPNTALSVLNGNVGIGTGGADAPIQIEATGETIDIGNGSATSTYIGFAGRGQVGYDGTSTYLGGSGGKPIALKNGSSVSEVQVTATQNVGIGTNITSTTSLTGATLVILGTGPNGVGNVGIGTTLPMARLSIAGNVGIGINSGDSYVTTTPPNGGMIVEGNVGIGSLTPGQALDVTGTVRTTNFIMSGQSPVGGYVLTAADSSGDTTWSSAGGVSGWTVSGNNVYETNSGNVGIGTTFLTTSALSVMNGNVGIGTWIPAKLFSVTGDTYHNGNIGIGTTFVGAAGEAALTVMNGNVGIGTWVPGGALVVMNGNVGIGSTSPNALLTVGNTQTTTSLSPEVTVNTVGNKPLFIGNGNTGGLMIGYLGNDIQGRTGVNYATNGILTLNYYGGNVGIATTSPGSNLSVLGGESLGSYATNAAPAGGIVASGNVGIGSLTPGQALDVTGTVRTTFFIMSGQSPTSGYVLTASDSSGDTTWSSAGGVSGWTVSGNNVYETASGNVGIGTTFLTTSALSVMNGNVGIGTWIPINALQVNGNLGIGSTGTSYIYYSPGSQGLISVVNGTSSLDVTVSSAQLASGSRFTWSSASTPNGGAADTGLSRFAADTMAVGSGASLDTSGTLLVSDIGVGTTLTTTAALSVMNGNVGIGTWVPGNTLQVNGNVGIGTYNSNNQLIVPQGSDPTIPSILFANSSGSGLDYQPGLSGVMIVAQGNDSLAIRNGVVSTYYSITPNNGVNSGTVDLGNNAHVWRNAYFYGNIGIGTILLKNSLDIATGGISLGTTYAGYLSAPTGGMIASGNVGIGSSAPGQALDVTGTVRTTNFIMSGQSPTSGYVLTAADSSGDTTWSSAGGVSGWTVSGNNVYETSGGNVGIGTTFLTTSALSVMNGNVGIGTWVPAAPFSVTGNSYFKGNVGISTTNPGDNLDINGDLRIIASQPHINIVDSSNSDIDRITFNSTGTLDSRGGIYYYNSSATPADQFQFRNAGNLTRAVLDSSGNLGVGTFLPSALLEVGNQKFDVLSGGNVGIGSINPGQVLDVQGTVKIDSPGTLIVPAGSSSNVSIGTVNNLNSGIYFAGANTYFASGGISIGFFSGNGFFAANSAAMGFSKSVSNSTTPVIYPQQQDTTTGIGDSVEGNISLISAGVDRLEVTNAGNIGIGSQYPGEILDVQGTIRTTNFIMSGQSPTSGYVLTAADSSGDTTWSSAGGVSGWTVSGNNVYETNSGNVGIGTTFLTTSALSVMNGNVGIGTWVPSNLLDLSTSTGGSVVIEKYGTTSSSGFATRYVGGTAASPVAPAVGDTTTLLSAYTGGATTITPNAQPFFKIGSEIESTGSTLTNANVYFYQNSTASGTPFVAMTIQGKSGNIGINTIVPGSILTVNGGVGIGTSVTNGAYLNGNTINGGGLIVQGNVGIGTFNPFGGNLIINGGNNVGIGSLAPGQILDVQGTTRVSGNVGIGSSITDSNGNQRLTITSSTVEISLQ